MKKFLKILGIILGAIVLIIAGVATWVNYSDSPSFETQQLAVQLPTDSLSLANGAKITQTLCGACHRGESGRMEGKLFSTENESLGEIWSANLTHHPTASLSEYSNGELAYLIRTGTKRDGKFAGPFMAFPRLSDEDLVAVIAYLRTDAPELESTDAVHENHYSFLNKALLKFGAFKPFPLVGKPQITPTMTDQIAFGRYLATARYECSSCHSASFQTYNVMEPEKSPGYMAGGNIIPDPDFHYVSSRNITPHPFQGVGKWTHDHFKAAIQSGIRPDGSALSLAMPRFSLLEENEVAAIWAYLQSLQPAETALAKVN